MGGSVVTSFAQVDKAMPVMSLTASRNVETVKRVIFEKYGLVVTDKFAQDLIDFVHALTDGQ